MFTKFQSLTALLIGVFVAWTWRNTLRYHQDILSDEIDDEYDYVIVGGGSAGSVVAARLSEENTVRVLLLEAGGFYDERDSFHIPIRWPEALFTEYDWGFYTEPQVHAHFGMKGQKVYIPRGRVLGGTGLLNGAVYTRGIPADFDRWASSGCAGWNYNDVLPYFLKSENMQATELKHSSFHNSSGPMAVSLGPDTPLTSLFLQAGQEIGYNIVDYNSNDIIGFSNIQYNIRNGVRSSTSRSFLGTGRRENLDISVRSFVTKLDINRGKAVGLYFIRNGRKRYVKVRKEIVISAGAINTPALLMLSGIGPGDHLSQLGIPVKADLPVGKNLLDRPGVIVINKINKPYDLTPAVITSWWSEVQYLFGTGPKAMTGVGATAFLKFNSSIGNHSTPDMQIEFLNMLFGGNLLNYKDDIANELFVSDPETHGFTMLLTLSNPRSTGSVRLQSKDPFDAPKIDLNMLSDEKDAADLLKAIRVWEQLIETRSMESIGASVSDMKMSFCSSHEFRSNGYWNCFVRHVMFSMFHQSGTCKMGSEGDPSAVVDPKLRVMASKVYVLQIRLSFRL